MTQKERAGGPLIKEWNNHFLRDDTEIRTYCSPEDEEAYSLFQIEPYGRVIVLTGSKKWAISRAEEIIKESSEQHPN